MADRRMLFALRCPPSKVQESTPQGHCCPPANQESLGQTEREQSLAVPCSCVFFDEESWSEESRRLGSPVTCIVFPAKNVNRCPERAVAFSNQEGLVIETYTPRLRPLAAQTRPQPHTKNWDIHHHIHIRYPTRLLHTPIDLVYR